MVWEIICCMSKSDDGTIPKFIPKDEKFDVASHFSSHQLQFINEMLFLTGPRSRYQTLSNPIEIE